MEEEGTGGRKEKHLINTLLYFLIADATPCLASFSIYALTPLPHTNSVIFVILTFGGGTIETQ